MNDRHHLNGRSRYRIIINVPITMKQLLLITTIIKQMFRYFVISSIALYTLWSYEVGKRDICFHMVVIIDNGFILLDNTLQVLLELKKNKWYIITEIYFTDIWEIFSNIN